MHEKRTSKLSFLGVLEILLPGTSSVWLKLTLIKILYRFDCSYIDNNEQSSMVIAMKEGFRETWGHSMGAMLSLWWGLGGDGIWAEHWWVRRSWGCGMEWRKRLHAALAEDMICTKVSRWERASLSEEPRGGQYGSCRQRKADYDSDREDKADEVRGGQTSGAWALSPSWKTTFLSSPRCGMWPFD